ncbi:MAG TPA: TlpA disulfide reductase family protein [Terriglobales bacterium]|nr:TlpA disulfide reductase family protein [Terriglobales bacterium]
MPLAAGGHGAMRFVIVSLLVAVAACHAPARHLERGEHAPVFVLSRLDGVPLRFPDDVRGRPLIIRFWADTCPFCEKELRDIEALHLRYGSASVAILTVNVGQSPAKIAEVVKRNHLTYPVLVDEESSVARLYGVVALPTAFFVGRDGTVHAKLLGSVTPETFERMLLEIM